jgi:hypothetical protein
LNVHFYSNKLFFIVFGILNLLYLFYFRVDRIIHERQQPFSDKNLTFLVIVKFLESRLFLENSFAIWKLTSPIWRKHFYNDVMGLSKNVNEDFRKHYKKKNSCLKACNSYQFYFSKFYFYPFYYPFAVYYI